MSVNFGKLDLCIIGLEVPEASIKERTTDQLWDGWSQNPPPDPLKKIGDHFIKERAFRVLKLPSAVMQVEFNCLLNPAHPDFKNVKVMYSGIYLLITGCSETRNSAAALLFPAI